MPIVLLNDGGGAGGGGGGQGGRGIGRDWGVVDL